MESRGFLLGLELAVCNPAGPEFLFVLPHSSTDWDRGACQAPLVNCLSGFLVLSSVFVCIISLEAAPLLCAALVILSRVSTLL